MKRVGTINMQPNLQRPFTVVLALATMAAVVAAYAPGEPTLLTWWDAVLKGAFAAAIVLAASKAPRGVTIAVAALATAAAGLSAASIYAAAALVVAIVAAILARRDRLLGALAGALTAQALLRLPSFGFFGLSALIAGFCCVVFVIAGYRYASRKSRKVVRRGGIAALFLAMVACLVGGLTVVGVRADLDQSVAATDRALAASKVADVELTAVELGRAQQALSRVDDRASSLLAQPLRLVPVAAQHRATLAVSAHRATLIVEQAQNIVGDVGAMEELLASGSIDLNALNEFAPRARLLEMELDRGLADIASTLSPWLLPSVRERVNDLLQDGAALLDDVQVAADAAEVVPEMMGAFEEKLYFVMFGTPAESRELGGLLGSWATVSVRNGSADLLDSGRIAELEDVVATNNLVADSVPPWFEEMGRPARFPQNLTSSPDFSLVAQAASQLLVGATPKPIDGFLYVDTWALVELLRLTGPVAIEEQEAPLTRSNAPDFFFRDQFLIPRSGRTELFDSLAAVADAVVDSLSDTSSLSAAEIQEQLGPMARAGRLQLVTADETHNDFLRSVHLLREFGGADTTDFVALVQTNGLPNKMDLYLERSLDYRAQLGSDGSIQATATATLRSVVPPDAPRFTLGLGETSGRNHVLLSLYTPHALTSVTVDGAQVDHQTTTEFGLLRYLVPVELEPTGEPAVVEFKLEGAQPAGLPYTLKAWHQPLVNDDQLSVLIEDAAGGRLEWSGSLVEDKVLTLRDDE